MSFFSIKKESDVVLVFDIGSGSVGGALVLTSKTHTPTILYTFRSEIPFVQEVTGVRLLSLMLRSLSQVTHALVHEGFGLTGLHYRHAGKMEVVVSLGAPWVVSRTSFLSLRNKVPSEITSHIFSELLKHSNEETRPKEKDIPKDAVQIDRRLIKSVLNGYVTSSPFGKNASEAEFAAFQSFSIPKVTEKISATIMEHIRPRSLHFHAFSLLAFLTIGKLLPVVEDFIIVDASGEQTELSLIRKGALAETATFPLGKHHLIRELKLHTEVPHAGAPALLALHAENKGDGQLFKRSKEGLDSGKLAWRKEFISSLSFISDEVFLPKSIFLCVDADVVSIFKDAILAADWNRFSLTQSNLQLVTVTDELIGPLIRYSSPEGHDCFLGLISASLPQLFKD